MQQSLSSRGEESKHSVVVSSRSVAPSYGSRPLYVLNLITKLSTALNSGLAFLCDVVITSALFYFIHPARNETVKLLVVLLHLIKIRHLISFYFQTDIIRGESYRLHTQSRNYYDVSRLLSFGYFILVSFYTNRIMQLAFFVAFLSGPGALIWLPFPIMLGKVYVNVLLVMYVPSAPFSFSCSSHELCLKVELPRIRRWTWPV